jgi:hypothetical protein
MTHCCKLDGCRKPLVMKPDERPNNFKRRVFCSLSCMARYRNSLRRGVRRPTEARACGNKACKSLMHRHPTEGIKRFNARQYCSKSCANVAKCGVVTVQKVAFREKQKNSRNLWQRQTYAHFANKEPRTVLHPEIKTVEEFIKRVGVKKCPPAYVAEVKGATPLRRDA